MSRSSFVSRRAAQPQSTRRKSENELTGAVVDCAMSIHKDLAPGLLETVYEAILEKKPANGGLEFKEGFRADSIVEDRVIVEVKAVEEVVKAHKRQLLTCLKLTDLQVGLPVNFGVAMMRDGIARVVNDFHD